MSEMVNKNMDAQEVVNRYRQLEAELQNITKKVNELESEKREYQHAIDRLQSLEEDRTAWHLIGSILRESTCAEVLQQTLNTFTGIEEIYSQFTKAKEEKEAEIKMIKEKYNLRMVTDQEAREIQRQNQQRA